MKAVKIQTDGSIKLQKEIVRLFPRTSELAVWTKGDMIILKRLSPLKPSEIAERTPEKEMPIEEIVAEVHGMRREKILDEDAFVITAFFIDELKRGSEVWAR